MPIAADSHPQPLWLGEENITGKTIFIWCEQGFGDTIQFCRYAKLLEARGAKVILDGQRGARRCDRSVGGRRLRGIRGRDARAGPVPERVRQDVPVRRKARPRGGGASFGGVAGLVHPGGGVEGVSVAIPPLRGEADLHGAARVGAVLLVVRPLAGECRLEFPFTSACFDLAWNRM